MNNLAKNLLEPPFTAGQCLQKRKQKELVTVVVGLICNNAVVLAEISWMRSGFHFFSCSS